MLGEPKKVLSFQRRPGSLPFEGDADRYRELFLSLGGGSGGRTSLWVVVAGSLHGEGATTVACGLASAMAENGPTVLLEANCRAPSTIIAEGGCGATLASTLRSRDQLAAALGGAAGLTVVPVGPLEEPAPASALGDLVDWLRERCRYGVIDVPPLLEAPDGLAVGDGVDGCVLVVEAERTSWQVAARARDLAAGAGLTPLGVVLNKRRYPIPRALYERLP